MPLPPEAIKDFQAIWKKQYGDDLPDGEAVARAHEFLWLIRFVLRRTRNLDAIEEARRKAPVDSRT